MANPLDTLGYQSEYDNIVSSENPSVSEPVGSVPAPTEESNYDKFLREKSSYSQDYQDKYYGNIEEAFGSSQADKLAALEQRKQEKLNRLGSKNQFQSLSSGYTELDNGLLESNANKIWNDLSGAEFQSVFDYAINNASLGQDDQGYFYKSTGERYEGPVRRSYGYGTKDDDQAYKFGLARGDRDSSDTRYIDYATGESGVDINKKSHDMLLPEYLATTLEALGHGRKGALKGRIVSDQLDLENYDRFGSGATEYYKSKEAFFGDPTSETYGERLSNEEAEDLLYRYATELTSPSKYYKGQYSDDRYIDAYYDKLRDQLNQEKSKNQNIIDEAVQTLSALPAGVAKGFIDLIDVGQEIVTYLPQLAARMATGDNTIDIDLFDDSFKKEVIGFTDNLVGYNRRLDEITLENAIKDLEAAEVDITSWDSIKAAFTDPEKRSKLGSAAFDLLTDPSLTASMVTELIGSGLGLGAATKVGAKTLAKISPVAQKTVSNVFQSNLSKLRTDVAAAAGNPAKIAELEKSYTLLKQIPDILKGSVYTNADMMVRMNNDITAFKENNNGEDPDAGKLLQMALLNRIASSAEVISLKSLLGIKNVPASVKKEAAKKGIIGAAGGVAAKLLKNGLTEATQETFDGVVEQINQKVDSADFKDKSVAEVLSEASAEIFTGTLAGTASGVQIGSLSGLSNLAGAGAAKVAETGAKNQAKVDEAALSAADEPIIDTEIPEKEATAAITEADTKANETIKKYIALASDEDLTSLVLSEDLETEEVIDTASISEGVEALEGTYSDIIEEIEQAEVVIDSRQNTERSKESDDINLKVLRKAKLAASRKILESEDADALGSGYSPEDVVDDFIQAKVEIEGDLDAFTEEDKALVNNYLAKNGQKPFRFKAITERLGGKDAYAVYEDSMGKGSNSAPSRRARLKTLLNTPNASKRAIEKEVKGISNFLNTQEERKAQYKAAEKELQKTINTYNKNKDKPGVKVTAPKAKTPIPGTDGKKYLLTTKKADGTYEINESSKALITSLDDTIDHLKTTLTRYRKSTVKALGKVPSSYSGLAVPASSVTDSKIQALREADEKFYQKVSPTKVFADETSVKKWQKGGDYLALNETKVATGTSDYTADDVILLTTLDIKEGSSISRGLAKAVKAGATVILDPSLQTPSGKEAKKEGAQNAHTKRINALAKKYKFGTVKVGGRQVWLPIKEAEEARKNNEIESKAKAKKDRARASLVRVFDVRTTAKEEKRSLTKKEIEEENKVFERAKEYFTGKDAKKNMSAFVTNALNKETIALEEKLLNIMLKEGTSSKAYSEALNESTYSTPARIADRKVKAREAELAKGGTLVKEWKEAQEADRKGEKTLKSWIKKTFGAAAKKVGTALLKDSRGSNVKEKKTFYGYQAKLNNGKIVEKISTNFKAVEDQAIDGVYTIIETDPTRYVEISNTTVLNTLSVEELKLEGEENALFNGFVASALQSLENAVQEKKKETILDFSDADSPASSLIYDKEGKLNANVAVAARAALYNFIKNNGYMLTKGTKSTQDIADMLGKHESEISIEAIAIMQDKGLLMKTAADSVGKDIASLLGIRAKSDDTVDAQNYSALVTELGQLALLMGMTKSEGLLSKSEMPSTVFASKVLGKKASDISESDAKVNFVDVKDADKIEEAIFEIDVINEILPGMDARRKEPSFKPLTAEEKREATKKVRNDKLGVDIPAKSKEALEKQMDTENVVNLPLLRFMIGDKNKFRIMKLLGYIDLESKEGKAAFEKLSYKEQQVQESKNRAILRNFENLTWLNGTTEENQESVSVWFKYFFSKNGRFFVDSNVLNPQTNKHLDRFLAQPKDHTNTYSYRKGEFYANGQKKPVTSLVYYALAQAFGYATDKKDVKSIEAFSKSIISEVLRPRSKANRLAKLNELREEFLNTGEVESLGIEIEHLGHALQGFEFLEKMITNRGKFDSAITAEFDAVTSGFALKLLQMPILKETLYKWLAKVGIFKTNAKEIENLGSESITMNNVLSTEGFLDSYQSLAADIKAISYEELRKNAAASAAKSSAKFNPLKNESKYTENLWNAVSNMLPSAENGISSELRSLFKYPFMTFNYASSIESIRGRLKVTIQDDIAKKIAAIDMDNIKEKEQPVIDMLKVFSGSDELKALKELQEQVRKKDLAFVKRGKGTSLGNYLEVMIDASYGVQVQNVLEDQFAPFVATQDTINNSFKAMFEVFKVSFEEKLKEARKKGPVSSKKEKEIYESLKNKWPAIKGPLSNMEREFDGEGTIGVYSTETASPNGIYSGRKAASTTLSEELRKELGTASIQTSHMIKALSAAISAGSVVPIHYVDGAVMAETILNTEGGITSIHDAIMTNLLRIAEGQKAYNSSAITASATYSFIDEIVKSLDRVIANTELFGEEKTEYQKAKLTLPDKTETNAASFLISTRNSMATIANSTNSARNKLFNELNEGSYVMHMAGTPEGVATFGEGNTVEYQQIDRYEQIEDNAKDLEELHTLAENHCKS